MTAAECLREAKRLGSDYQRAVNAFIAIRKLSIISARSTEDRTCLKGVFKSLAPQRVDRVHPSRSPRGQKARDDSRH